jgi:hypothetical protein
MQACTRGLPALVRLVLSERLMRILVDERINANAPAPFRVGGASARSLL